MSMGDKIRAWENQKWADYERQWEEEDAWEQWAAGYSETITWKGYDITWVPNSKDNDEWVMYESEPQLSADDQEIVDIEATPDETPREIFDKRGEL